MGSHGRILCAVILFLACYWQHVAVVDAQVTQRAPIIESITPSFGSVEGGTRLTITGANFAQGGLFSVRSVLVGGELCKVIEYFSNDLQLVCYTPKCFSPDCLSSPTWTGSVSVNVDVQVITVEGAPYASTTFTFNGYRTPAVYKMSHTTYSSATSYIVGALYNPELANIQIKIDGSFAEVGKI